MVAHPHTNGQFEHANSMILQGLKPRILTKEGEDVHARLSTQAGKWVAEVPSVPRSLRMMPNWLTSFTPFIMVYGIEAVVPSGLQYWSPRVQTNQPNAAEEAGKNAINLLKESRDTAVIRSVGVSTIPPTVSCVQGSAPDFPGRQLSFETDTNQER
jgi:hypothetical protein